MKRSGPCSKRRVDSILAAALLLSLAAGIQAIAAPEGDAAGPAAAGAAERGASSADSARTPEAIWRGFVKHMKSSGHEDLLPPPPVEDPAPESEPGDTHVEATHVPGPGDPILTALRRLAPSIPLVESLLSPESRDDDPAAGEARRQRAAGLLDRLESEPDPYVREYARFFRARLALESGQPRRAIELAGSLADSRLFNSEAEAHRLLARAYRAVGDDTLALLELRLFLLHAGSEEFVERRWAEEQIAAIREGNVGPLDDSAHDARAASALLSSESTSAPTQIQQERVEAILERAARLLTQSPSAAAPCCDSAAAGKPCDPECQRRKTARAALAEQQRVEAILDGVVRVLDTTCPRCKEGSCTSECKNPQCRSSSACSKCGYCPECGAQNGQQLASGADQSGRRGQGQEQGQGQQQGQGAQGRQQGAAQNGEGDPRGDRPGETAAQDTKIRKGDPKDVTTRDREFSSREAWGRINDRDVARSLRELWNKIPVAYRDIVTQYYLDITDLAPPEEAAKD